MARLNSALGDNKRNAAIFFLALAVMALIIALPTPEPFYKGTEAISLTADGKIVMAVLCFAVILWMTEAIPFPATSLCLSFFCTFWVWRILKIWSSSASATMCCSS